MIHRATTASAHGGQATARLVLLPLLLAALPAAPARAEHQGVHLAYHWHLHQPIYWPERHPDLNRYQFAAESLDLKSAGGNRYPGSPYAHPRNNLGGGDGEYDAVFDKDDRRAIYQSGGRNAIATLGGHPDAGASISYSGALMENIGSFGRQSRLGYGPDWNQGYTQARAWQTSGGCPRADLLGMTYHHAFSPLLPPSVLRKEIRIFKELWWKTWNGRPDKADHSRGFWPVEAAFSVSLIPLLRAEGYEWVIVANSHLARTCPNYLDIAVKGVGGYNIDPPNRADQLGPSVPAAQWYSGSRDARGGAFPAPFAYQVHRARHVDPRTGAATLIAIVPMCDYLSYENGYGAMGTDTIDARIAPFNDPAHPCLVLLAHDGDNAWGGGSSYYFESVPGLMNAAAARGYRPTTIQQFLLDHPPPENDVVHVEDGAWVNAANDWGHPQFVNWLWPPTRAPDDPARLSQDPRTWYDFDTPGWTEDWRNWAVVIAGANWCETAEQITLDTGGRVEDWKIQEPVQPNGVNNHPNDAEQAWHYYLAGLDSGFMYYGTALDDEVKQTLACNRALAFARAAVNAHPALDRTPPTVLKPQRFPWNPGGKGWGPLTGYRPVGFEGQPPYASEFHVWTHVYDLSGVAGVTLFVRADADGVNPLADDANETYAGGPGVGPWTALPMTRRPVPKGNVTGNPEIGFFLEPEAIADYYVARVSGFRDQLLDYYVEAVDALGNAHQSEIQHVFVADDGSAPPPVTFSADPRDCAPLAVVYRSAGRPLEAAAAIDLHLSFDAGATWAVQPLTNAGGGEWTASAEVPPNAPSATVWFSAPGLTNRDDNGGRYWSVGIRHCAAAPLPAAVEFAPPAPTGCVPLTVAYFPNDGLLKDAAQVYLHLGRNGWQDLLTPDPPMTRLSNGWSHTLQLAPGTWQINCCFHDGRQWDSRGGANWSVAVAGCGDASAGGLRLVPGTPSVSGDPDGQNHPGDAFDLSRAGGWAGTVFQGGFGSFGQLYLNYDRTNLYLGACGADLTGSNNAMIVFLGLDTLADDAPNLWHLSGPPAALDRLHNLAFARPMDLAIVLGDEYGDGTFPSFALGDGADVGQGVFYLSASGAFVPVAGARLSQFDGLESDPTRGADDDGDRLMNRWEAALPWASLGASNGLADLGACWLAGVIVSSSVGGPQQNDRYLSGNYLGAAAAGPLTGNNYGFGFLTLTPTAVALPPVDSDADGLPDSWERAFAGGLALMQRDSDTDGDRFADYAEYVAGTDPLNPTSRLEIAALTLDPALGAQVRWTGVTGKLYRLLYATNLPGAFLPLESGIPGVRPWAIDPAAAPGRFYRLAVEP